MTDQRILLADIDLTVFRIEPPVASPLSDVSIVEFRTPSWWYPFTDVALMLPNEQQVQLRFSRRWSREAEVLESNLRFDDAAPS